METTVEFPDKALAASPKHGVVFRMPKLEITEDEGSEADYEDRRHRFIRPHSAIGPSLELPSRMLPSKSRGIRPWSAHSRTTKTDTDSQRKISRQTLRKPHFSRPPPRSPSASISSDSSSLITAVGLANRLSKIDTPDSSRSTENNNTVKSVSNISPQSLDRWAITLPNSILERKEPEPDKNTEPIKRSQKKYPSFDTWIDGSPHDSDEYDTDIDIEEFVKNLEEELEKDKQKRRRRMRKKKKGEQLEEKKPIDPTGRAMYMDQCNIQGLVPVSYIQRHLEDKNIRMRHHYLGGIGTKPIAVALWNNTITETLDIGDNFVEGEGARYIAGMLKHNTFITNLNISSNFIGKDGLVALSSMLESNTTLKVMCVSGNQLTDSCAQCLIDGLKNNSSLMSLDLSGNDFGELGGIYIGGAMSVNEGLLDLDLSWNSIRNKGATAVISSLSKNKTVEVLDVSWNGLGLAGAEALKQTLKINTTLKVLDLTNNRLNTKAAESLAWGLSRNVGLETLVLNMNPIKDAGVEAILKAVEKHPNLKLLSIEEIGISRANYDKIRELESQNDLTILHGGVGGYQRVTTAASMIRLFIKFVRTNQAALAFSCQQHDRDRNGLLGLDELKMALREGGLRLTGVYLCLRTLHEVEGRHIGVVLSVFHNFVWTSSPEPLARFQPNLVGKKQLNTVLDELNYTNSNTMNYKDILSGKTMDLYFNLRPSRAFAMKSIQLGMNTLPDTLHRQLTVA